MIVSIHLDEFTKILVIREARKMAKEVDICALEYHHLFTGLLNGKGETAS